VPLCVEGSVVPGAAGLEPSLKPFPAYRYFQAHAGENAKQSTVLLPTARQKGSHRNKDWKLYVNAKVEGELRPV